MQTDTFSPEEFINKILTETGFDKSEPEIRQQMSDELLEQLSHIIHNTLLRTVPEHEIREAEARFADSSESYWDFAFQLAEISPSGQQALVDEINKFYETTLNAYQQFKHKGV